MQNHFRPIKTIMSPDSARSRIVVSAAVNRATVLGCPVSARTPDMTAGERRRHRRDRGEFSRFGPGTSPVSVVRSFASSACPRTAAVSPARLWRVCFCARRRARYFSAHPVDPQRRAIGQVVELVGGGGLIAYPTDPCLHWAAGSQFRGPAVTDTPGDSSA
jgi:hypothetical protein